MLVSARKLRNLNACRGQVRAFVRIFGKEEIRITKELCLKYANVFLWDGAATILLSYEEQAAYDVRLKTHVDAYEGAIRPIRKAYYKAELSHDVFDEAIKLHRETFNKACATTFGELAEKSSQE